MPEAYPAEFRRKVLDLVAAGRPCAPPPLIGGRNPRQTYFRWLGDVTVLAQDGEVFDQVHRRGLSDPRRPDRLAWRGRDRC